MGMTDPLDKKREEIVLTEEQEIVIPVHEESLLVDIETVETGQVQIDKRIATEDIQLDIPLNFNEIDIQRVSRNVEVEEMPVMRQEGDTTIIPVVKEVAVVVKKLMLVEEIIITNTQKKHTDTYETTLRSEYVEVNREESA
jgi:uncharacterized protein (TIGR02271 family)